MASAVLSSIFSENLYLLSISSTTCFFASLRFHFIQKTFFASLGAMSTTTPFGTNSINTARQTHFTSQVFRTALEFKPTTYWDSIANTSGLYFSTMFFILFAISRYLSAHSVFVLIVHACNNVGHSKTAIHRFAILGSIQSIFIVL